MDNDIIINKKNMDSNHISLDKIRGMFIGAFCGDALGIPHEFRCNRNVPYTGILEHEGFRISKFQGKKELQIGQLSDDSEMTITLLRTIIRDGGYIKDNVIMEYIEWANSGGWMMGKNTRELLKGIKTLRGYQGRINKILNLPISEISQSNGALMRCSPLALLNDNISVIEDVNITNPNYVCEDCNMIYVLSLRLALRGYDGITIFNKIKNLAQSDEVKFVLNQVENKEYRNIGENKGWCLHALWCAMMVITNFQNFSEAMRWVITSQKGTDTDTNACISGALLGAILGFEKLQSESDTKKNIDIILNVDTTKGTTQRPIKYSPHDFYTLTEEAHTLFMNKFNEIDI